MAKSFSATVDAWVGQSKERMVAVRNLAVEKTEAVAQRPVALGGNMPIKTNFLRASIRATKDGSLPALRSKPDGDAKHTYDPGQLTLVLIGAKLSDKITLAWTANYAAAVNYGSGGRPARMFVGLAAQQWPRTVAEAAHAVKARAGG